MKKKQKKIQQKVRKAPAVSNEIKKSDVQPEKPSFRVKGQESRAKDQDTLPLDTIGRKIYQYVMQLSD